MQAVKICPEIGAIDGQPELYTRLSSPPPKSFFIPHPGRCGCSSTGKGCWWCRGLGGTTPSRF